MDEELKIRFLIKKIQDIQTNHCNPVPTVICDMERIEIIELVRQNCLFSGNMVKLTAENIKPLTTEGLEISKKPIDWGELYIPINVN
jgi:hypothetical protein